MSQDVVVVGGGFSGSAVAAALSATGARVTVVEAMPTNPQFRGELIHPRGVRALEALGFTRALKARAHTDVAGFAVSPSDGGELMVLPYGRGAGLGIDHHELVAGMRQELATRQGVAVRMGEKVVDFVVSDGRVCGVVLANKEVLHSRLVVVADGRQSRLRSRLGMEPEVRLLSHTLVFAVEGDLLPRLDFGHVFLGAPGPVLAYPYGPGKVRFCVDVPLGLAKGKAALRTLLEERYAPAVPRPLREAMVEAIRASPVEGCATHAISTSSCAARGVVLVGDSGGCAHPLTASGMTNALNDVLTLQAAVRRQGLSEAALARYQRRRYDFVRMRELFTDALYEVFRAQEEGSAALQRGVFTYWRSSERARAASMDILSGEDVRPSRFVAEYSRVAGLSAVEVLTGLERPADVVGQARTLGSLVKTGVGQLELAVGRTARTVVQRYRLRVPPLDPRAAA